MTRALLFLILTSTFGFAAEAAPAPPTPDLVITKAQARTLFEKHQARMIIHYAPGEDTYPNGRSYALFLLDFTREKLQFELLCEDVNGSGGDPTISPDGSRFLYNTGNEIFIRQLKKGGPGKARIGPGLRALWWSHPVSGDEFIIFTTSKDPVNPADMSGVTYMQKIRKKSCEPEGSPLVLLENSVMCDGRSPDGRFICGTHPGCQVMELDDPLAVEKAKGKVLWSAKPACNGSICPDPKLAGLFVFTDKHHDRIIFSGTNPPPSIPLPPGYKHVQWCHWSTHGDYLSASPSVTEDWTHPDEHDGFIYQASAQSWTQVTRKCRSTHLWVNP